MGQLIRSAILALALATVPASVMAQSANARLKALGYVVPTPKAIQGVAGAVKAGNLLFVSAQLPYNTKGRLLAKGVVGKNVSQDTARNAAKNAALAVLASAAAEAGTLSNIQQVVRVDGLVACAPGKKIDPDNVVESASRVMNRVFNRFGKHTRSAACVSSLPQNAPVTISAIFELKQ